MEVIVSILLGNTLTEFSMEWYWIVLIIFAYLLGWGITIGICEKELDDGALGVLTGLIWPIMMPLYFGFKIVKKDK